MSDTPVTHDKWARHTIRIIGVLSAFFIISSVNKRQSEVGFDLELTYPTESVEFNSSLAIYVIVGHNHSLKPDLRGKYWEFQLPYVHGGHIYVYYMSDYYGKANGVKFLMPEWESSYFPDKNMVKRTKYTWMHFSKYHNRVKWHLRITTDTFLNISALLSMIRDLERNVDPMKEVIYRYNVFEFTDFLFPHGGPGWLASNAAITRDTKNIELWDNLSRWSVGDDVAMKHYLNACGHNVTDFLDTRFAVMWPRFQDDIVLRSAFYTLETCPRNFTITSDGYVLEPTVIREAVSLHMHFEPMDRVALLLSKIPANVLIATFNGITQLCLDRQKYYT